MASAKLTEALPADHSRSLEAAQPRTFYPLYESSVKL